MNNLLTEHDGRTGEYWPEVVAVPTTKRDYYRAASGLSMFQYRVSSIYLELLRF